jgi:hypothetical protein
MLFKRGMIFCRNFAFERFERFRSSPVFVEVRFTFLESSTMKKSLIPVLLVIAIFGGCQKNGSSGTTDTTKVAALPAASLAGPATTMITPAVVSPVDPKVAGPIIVTSNTPTPNKICIAVIFNAQPNQTVKVTNMQGADIADFPDAHNNNFPQVLPGPMQGVTYRITATVNGNAYTNVTPNVGNSTSDDAQTFTDNNNNSVTVFVMDLGTANP